MPARGPRDDGDADNPFFFGCDCEGEVAEWRRLVVPVVLSDVLVGVLDRAGHDAQPGLRDGEGVRSHGFLLVRPLTSHTRRRVVRRPWATSASAPQ